MWNDIKVYKFSQNHVAMLFLSNNVLEGARKIKTTGKVGSPPHTSRYILPGINLIYLTYLTVVNVDLVLNFSGERFSYLSKD